MTILDKIVAYKREEIAAAKAQACRRAEIEARAQDADAAARLSRRAGAKKTPANTA